jgi:hypothetical protein
VVVRRGPRPGRQGDPQDGRRLGVGTRRAARRHHPHPRSHAAAAYNHRYEISPLSSSKWLPHKCFKPVLPISFSVRQEVMGIPAVRRGLRLREGPWSGAGPQIRRLRVVRADNADALRDRDPYDPSTDSRGLSVQLSLDFIH